MQRGRASGDLKMLRLLFLNFRLRFGSPLFTKFLFVLFGVVTLTESGLGQIAACPATASRSACNSFQQMRAAKDPDITHALAEEFAFICLSPKKDRFFTVAFSTPRWTLWFPDRDKEGKLYVEDWATGADVSLHAEGSVSMQFFEDDMSDQTLVFSGSPDRGAWRTTHAHYVSNKPVVDPSGLHFYGDCNDPDSGLLCSLRIDQAEIKMDESLSGNHWVTIRRSTKRFVETVGDETVTGQCLEFKKTKRPQAKTQ
jgi:hypothetical protein